MRFYGNMVVPCFPGLNGQFTSISSLAKMTISNISLDLKSCQFASEIIDRKSLT